MHEKLIKDSDNEILILGRMTAEIKDKNKYKNIHIFNSIEDLTSSCL
jgi:hypothetical protein